LAAPQTLSVREVCAQTGLSARTVRYYEQLGLLPPAQRTAAGYRVYGAAAAARLRFIRRAQALGFSLEEVAELLALSDNPRARARDVKRVTQAKIADITQRIDALERMKQGLATLEAHCSGHGHTGECPILAALNQADA